MTVATMTDAEIAALTPEQRSARVGEIVAQISALLAELVALPRTRQS